MDAEAIRRWDLRAREGFSYLADPPAADTWRSHRADILAGRPWRGDCDDLTSTALDVFVEDGGAALADLYRVEVVARNAPGPNANHLIACLWDDAGVCWIVGDTFGEAYPAADCLHRPVSYQRMDEAGTHDGAPWAQA